MENNHFSKLNKTNFKVPEDYFESVEDRILSRMSDLVPESNSGRTIQMTPTRSKLRTIVFAALATAACLTFMIFYNNIPEEQNFNLSELENTEIINFLNENADDVDLDFLVSKSENTGSALEILETETFNIDQDELIDDINIDELY